MNPASRKNISKVIAIDNDVKNSLPKKLDVTVIRNVFNKKNIKKKKSSSKILNIGYVGTFLKYKGVEDLIIAFNNLRLKNYKIKLYLAGRLIRKKNFLLNLLGFSNDIDDNLLNSSKNIINLGYIDNLDNFYKKIDVLCFPSYLNALGRQIFEAGLYKLPSIVCMKKNSSDSFIKNKTGISFKNPGSINELENLIKSFYNNRSMMKFMGGEAYKLISKNFSKNKNVKKLNLIYEELI